jgi:hypothetical protein
VTTGFERPITSNAALDNPAVRTLLATLALALGVGIAWLAGGRLIFLAGLAILVAAGNGYSKAYSP